MKGDRDYNPQADVQLRPVQDARFRVRFIQPGRPCGEIAQAMADSIMKICDAATRPEPMPVWGRYRGSGRSFRVRRSGKSYEVRVFVAPVARMAFLSVMEFLPEADSGEVQPGFDLVRDSFISKWK